MILPQPLPYDTNALQPFLAQHLVESHYHEYATDHFNVINSLMNDTLIDGFSLDHALYTVSRGTCNHALLHHLCSAWNHDFFWAGLSPTSAPVYCNATNEICRQFGSITEFKIKFAEIGSASFGSGWTWLTLTNGKLIIKNSPCSRCPSLHTNSIPLFVVDGWEHAYVSQYGNNKRKYYDAVLNLINWERINDRFC